MEDWFRYIKQAIESGKKNWKVAAPVALICVTATWYIAYYIVLENKNSTIENLQTTIKLKENEIDVLNKQLNELNKRLSNCSIESLIVLEPTWIYKGKAVQTLSGHVLIKVSDTFDFLKEASLELDIAGQNSDSFFLHIGNRKSFNFKNQSYFINVLDVSGSGAQISVVKQV